MRALKLSLVVAALAICAAANHSIAQQVRLTADQQRDFLLKAKVIDSRPIGRGITGSLRLTLSDDEPGVHTRPHAHVGTMEKWRCGAQRAHTLVEIERRTHRAKEIILVRRGHAEQHHRFAAREVIDDAAMAGRRIGGRIAHHRGEPVDVIRSEAFERSQVMDHLFYLTDVYGPRIASSPNYRKAAEWARL